MKLVHPSLYIIFLHLLFSNIDFFVFFKVILVLVVYLHLNLVPPWKDPLSTVLSHLVGVTMTLVLCNNSAYFWAFKTVSISTLKNLHECFECSQCMIVIAISYLSKNIPTYKAVFFHLCSTLRQYSVNYMPIGFKNVCKSWLFHHFLVFVC